MSSQSNLSTARSVPVVRPRPAVRPTPTIRSQSAKRPLPETRPLPAARRAVLLAVAAAVCGAFLSQFSGCAMQSYTDRGAAVGSLTGAAMGAAIGENNDAPLLGTAIGALAGAAVGGAVGSGIDADVAQVKYEQQQQVQVGMNDLLNSVATMSQQGVSEQVITNHVRSTGVPRPPTANEIINLKNSGVSDSVIASLQTSVAPVAVRGPTPVIVEEVHHWGPPPVVYRPVPRRYCPPPYPARRGLSWGFSYNHRHH